MPITIQPDLPAKAILESENIFMMEENRALKQDIRPLSILILNIMPVKEETETQLLRALSNTPIQVDCTFMHMSTHISKNTSASHLNKFYVEFNDVKQKRFDGMIITGAPLEHLKFEEVGYWSEFAEILEWSKQYVTSTLHICWGAQAALYYHYGIPKYEKADKLSGIYRHKVLEKRIPLVRGFDDWFHAPHSRYTEVIREDIEKIPELMILAESKEAGIYLAMNQSGSQVFVQGHPEYDRMTLANEYKRDLDKGLDVEIPVNYFENNDTSTQPMLTWRVHANTLYTNWLNFFVYQQTPYNLEEIPLESN